MYKYLTGMENLLQFAAMNKKISRQRIKDVVEMVGLQHRVNDKVSTYSLGMRQRWIRMVYYWLLNVYSGILARHRKRGRLFCLSSHCCCRAYPIFVDSV